MDLERRRVVYHGEVQGVGFRYTALRLAHGKGVKGFVRNLANGSVELVVEGTTSVVEGFLGDIEGRMNRNITKRDTETMPATGEFDSFDIRR